MADIAVGDDLLAEAGENGRRLGPGGASLGAEAVAGEAADEAHAIGPGHGLLGVAADGAGVLIARQVGPGGHVIALAVGVAEEDEGHLLPGDGVVGAELPIAVAPHNAVGRGPAHGVVIPAPLGHIGEGDFPLGPGPIQPVQDGHNHAPGGGVVGVKGVGLHAAHELLGVDIGHRVVGPVAGGYVGKGVLPCCQSGGGKEGEQKT